jgi:hypothetical protein
MAASKIADDVYFVKKVELHGMEKHAWKCTLKNYRNSHIDEMLEKLLMQNSRPLRTFCDQASP